MAFKHGKNTQVLLNSTDLSPYLNAADLSLDADTAETTTFTSSWKTAIVGTSGMSYELGGLYDPTLTTMAALTTTDFGSVLTVAPAGASAIGDRVRMMSVAETAYGESSAVGDAIAFSATLMGTGALGDGQVLHVLGEDTNTTTGAEKDDAAATTTGWMAHLHVTLVDGGSWVIKLQDAAVSNTYSDVTGGAFTAATGTTSQRLVGASGATLRRYVRYVATRTGGSAGDGITFALSYSRNN